MTGAGNHTYLFAGTDGRATLIDAGVGDPRHLAAIAEQLADGAKRLDRVLVTHAHPDHASGAANIATAHPSAAFLKFPWPDEDRKYPVAWAPIADGERFEVGGAVITALHTPGHSPDHMAFWEDSTRTMFSGDLVIQDSSVMIHASRGGDLAAYLTSLERLLALDPQRLLPAHGPAVTNAPAVLRAYIAHRLMREQQVLAALEAGHHSVRAIAESIYDGLDAALMPAAQENVRAHLEKLRREGRAFEQGASWRL